MWELLPKELQLLVVQTLVRDLGMYLRVENSDLRNAVLQARSIDRMFAHGVGHLWRLFTPFVFVGPLEPGVFAPTPGYVMRADAAESFVEGVMRHYCELVLRNRAVSTDTYSALYTVTYTACVTRQPYNLSNRLYVAISNVGRRLVEDGTLRRLQGVYQHDRWTQLVFAVFRTLDRWYLPRHGLPDVHAALRAIFIEPDTRAA
jgi:hypothetical protein